MSENFHDGYLKNVRKFYGPLRRAFQIVQIQFFPDILFERHRISDTFSLGQGSESPKNCLVLVPFFSASPKNVLVLVPYFSAASLKQKFGEIGGKALKSTKGRF